MASNASPAQPNAARKDDQGKPQIHLVDPLFIEAVASVLTFGAQKYAAWNWAKGMDHSRVYNAAMRHLLAYWRGEETDAESGLPHLWHASCCLMFLVRYHHSRVGADDRFDFSQFERLVEQLDLKTVPAPAAANDAPLQPLAFLMGQPGATG